MGEAREIEHGYMVAIDPPGRENRRWRCEHCGDEGPLMDLARRPCDKSRPATDGELIDAIEGKRPARRRSRWS